MPVMPPDRPASGAPLSSGTGAGCLVMPFLFVGMLAFGAAAVMLPLESFKAAYHGMSPQGWSTVQGTMLTSGGLGRSSRGSAVSLGVEYQYLAAGRKYRSQRLRFGNGIGFPNRPAAEAYARVHYPAGPVTVYYRTTSPDVAVLETGLHAGFVWWADALVAPLFCLGLCAGAGAMLWGVARGKAVFD
jgi:hypothetical protein